MASVDIASMTVFVRTGMIFNVPSGTINKKVSVSRNVYYVNSQRK